MRIKRLVLRRRRENTRSNGADPNEFRAEPFCNHAEGGVEPRGRHGPARQDPRGIPRRRWRGADRHPGARRRPPRGFEDSGDLDGAHRHRARSRLAPRAKTWRGRKSALAPAGGRAGQPVAPSAPETTRSAERCWRWVWLGCLSKEAILARPVSILAAACAASAMLMAGADANAQLLGRGSAGGAV